MSGMPEPPRQSRAALIGCLMALLACACVLHAEVLFGGHVYHMDDAADGYYPGHIAVRRAFAAGELPTWERGSWCGWPLIVDPYNGVFYPLNVIYYVLGAARGLGPAIALHALLGGVGMLLLLRRRRLSYGAALFGALAYELSSFGVVRIRHVIFVQMMAWLPWILWAVERWLAERRRRDLALVAGATGMALVAGALSIGHFAALAIAAYTLVRCVPPVDDTRSSSDRLRRFTLDAGLLAAAAVLGALCAAAQILPTVAHLPYSPRSLGSDYRFASSYAWPSLRYLVTLAWPDAFGGEDRGSYHGAPNHWELAGYYVGLLPWLLAPVALLPSRKRSAATPPDPAPRRVAPGAAPASDRWVLVALVLLAIALALGDTGPVHPFFYRHLPLYAALRCPARALMITVIAMPILGAFGMQALLDRIAAWRPRLVPFSVAALCLAGAVNLLVVDRGYVALYHKPADHPDGMERFAAIEWLRANGGPPSENRMVNDPRGPFRLHNIGMVLGLENASGYDSVAVWRYVDFLHLLRFGHRYPHRELRDDFAAIGVWNLDSRLLDLMNVRWVVGAESPGAPGPRWIERFRPTGKESGPAAKWEPYWNAQLRVFENSHVLPRAFIAHRAEVPAGDEQLAARLLSPGFDPGRVALLEEAPGPLLAPVAGGAGAGPGPGPGVTGGAFGVDAPPVPGTMVSAQRHHVVIDTNDPLPGILMVSEVHYPGWSATVDGQPAKLLRADWAFRGVALPSGRHRVELAYRSTPTRIGIGLSLLALLGTIALALL